MIRLCRRRYFLSSLSLSLLLLLIWGASITMDTTSVTPGNTIRGGTTPVINHLQGLESVGKQVSIATPVLDRNSEDIAHSSVNPERRVLPHTTTDNRLTHSPTVSVVESGPMKLNGSVTGVQADPLTHRAPVRRQWGMVGGAVWRERERETDSETKRLQQMFPLSRDIAFPNPQITLPVSAIDNSHWMTSLRKHLANRAGRNIINLVTSNSQYQDVLLNWLISAVVRSRIDLQSVLVVSMDLPLHMRLTSRGIPSVNVPLYKIIRRDTNFTKPFDRVMMLRLTVMRVLSNWGFDVHNYDTDAVLLRDPQPLYDQFPDVNIIGSVGRIPAHLMTKWGITICIGVVIIRGSPLVEQYWEAMSKSCESSLDDQEKLNCGLEGLGMKWDNPNSNQNTTVVSGRCETGLEVRVLPFRDICRLATCDPTHRGDYYVWHKGGSRTRRDKLKGSREGHTWFLRYQWNKIDNDLIGREWLDSIAYWNVTRS